MKSIVRSWGAMIPLAVACAMPWIVASPLCEAQVKETAPPHSIARTEGIQAPLIRYEDIAAEAGLIASNISGSESDAKYIVETTGTGVAIFDYDNDGLPDLFFVNADRLQKSDPPPTHHLYHNLGNLRFEDVTEKAGITYTGWGQGSCVGDVDNDGYPDLFITQWGRNVFYKNMRNGTFQDETKKRGLWTSEPRWSTGCAFLDFNRDGHLDLVVVHYVSFDLPRIPLPGDSGCQWKGTPVMCGPRGLPGENVTLYQNDGNGHFIDVSERMGLAGPKNYYGLTALTGDFDNDGWPDIYVTCDSTPNLYYHNLNGKSFEEVAPLSGLALNEDGREQAGMGATAGDPRGVGLLDIFKTNFMDDTHTYYRNLGHNNFEDSAIPNGLAVNTRYLGWGTAFLDFDNDGWEDLIVVNGHVYPQVDKLGNYEKFKQSRLLYRNRGKGMFEDVSAASGNGISARHSSRGLAVGDLDNDGDLEIVVVNLNEPPSLLKNRSKSTGNALLVRVINDHGSDAIGAQVTVTSATHKQIDEVRSGGSYLSQSDFRLHFGLGKAAVVNLSIRWPDGKTETVTSVAANQIVTVQEGKGIVRKQPFTHAKL